MKPSYFDIIALDFGLFVVVRRCRRPNQKDMMNQPIGARRKELIHLAVESMDRKTDEPLHQFRFCSLGKVESQLPMSLMIV